MKSKLLFAALLFSAAGIAKDIKTLVVTTTPQMHCSNCEVRIKGNLRFEHGVKSIKTSIPNQTVTIKYDADQVTPEQLIEAFKKFGYEAQRTATEAQQQAPAQPGKGK